MFCRKKIKHQVKDFFDPHIMVSVLLYLCATVASSEFIIQANPHPHSHPHER